MKRIYIGCENAASATAKIEFSFNETYYFGNGENAADFINTAKKTWNVCDWTYSIYLREINWNTGAYGNWWCVENGNRVSAHSTIVC